MTKSNVAKKNERKRNVKGEKGGMEKEEEEKEKRKREWRWTWSVSDGSHHLHYSTMQCCIISHHVGKRNERR